MTLYIFSIFFRIFIYIFFINHLLMRWPVNDTKTLWHTYKPLWACSLIKYFACRLKVLWLLHCKLLTEQHLEFLSFKAGCAGSSKSTLAKMPYCRQSHVTAHIWASARDFDTYSVLAVKRRWRPRQKVWPLVNMGFCCGICAYAISITWLFAYCKGGASWMRN